MTSASYFLYLNNPVDQRLLAITDFISLEYVRPVNVPGTMTLILPSSIDRTLFKRDTRLEIWRNAGSTSYLETKTQWLVRRVIFDNDNQTTSIIASSLLQLLDRRIIAYDSGTSQSSKSGAADTIIQEFVVENLGGSATDTNRDWSSYINFPTPPGNGQTSNKSASRRNLLKTCQEIAQQSAKDGTPLFFDIEYNPDSKKMIFLTFTEQRGIDLTSGQTRITLSPQFGTLSKVFRTEDYSTEITYAYAAGQGVGTARAVTSASDADRINSSPFGRIESLVDSRNTSNTTDLQTDADAAVRNGRPVRTFQGQIVNTKGVTYGVNWNWGDKLNAEIDGEVIIARLDTINVSVSEGDEVINVGIRAED